MKTRVCHRHRDWMIRSSGSRLRGADGLIKREYSAYRAAVVCMDLIQLGIYGVQGIGRNHSRRLSVCLWSGTRSANGKRNKSKLFLDTLNTWTMHVPDFL